MVTRGETLVMIDVRSGYALDFIFIAGKYNSSHIRGLTLSVHDKVGLPDRGFHFENGVWRSRMVAGTSGRDGVPWRLTELGLREQPLGLEISHARLARAKTIENLWGIWQNHMEAEPGYCGRNEQVEVFERTQKFLRLARGGDLAAISKLHTDQHWIKRLAEIFNAYNNDPQNGKMLQGQTPAEMFQERLARKPLRKLPPSARYVLASHRRTATVRKDGIKLQVHGRDLWYYSEEIWPLVNRQVLTWFNLEYPKLLTVTDMSMRNPITVPLQSVRATGATKEEMADAARAQSSQLNYAKALYGNIQHNFISNVVRDNEIDEETKAVGRFQADRTAEAIGQDEDREQQVSGRQLEAEQREREARQKFERKQAAKVNQQ